VVHHGDAAPVVVRAGRGGGPAHLDLVRAAHALAALVVRGEQVVVAVALDHGRALDGLRAGRPGGDRVHRAVAGGLLAGGRVEPDHLDPRPPGAEVQPPGAVAVHEEVGVDGVVGAAGGRGDDDSLVAPGAGAAAGGGGQADRGVVGAEGRDGVVEQVPA